MNTDKQCATCELPATFVAGYSTCCNDHEMIELESGWAHL